MDDDDDLLTTEEAAKILRCEKKTLINWRREGKGPPFVKLGRKVFYRRGDLREYILKCRRQSTSDLAPPNPKSDL